MKRLIDPTKRVLISCTTLTVVGVLAHGLFSNQASAQDVPTCASLDLPNPVYLAGSSAVQTVIAALGPKFAAAATPTTLVYTKAGSCDGVNSIVANLSLTSTANYWDAAGTKGTCTLSGEKASVGLSDVFATSCPEVTAASLTGIGDFQGPVQSMNFAVPIAATQNAISAEAAYLLVGFGAQSATDWSNPALYAFRNFQSGTQTMIASAINVPTSKWPATADKGGSSGVVTALASPTGSADATIGILASNEADDNRDKIKRLAYRHYGQECAYYPDSTYSSKDKLNVREGHYAVWGPLHMLAKVNASNVPTNAAAKAFLDIMLGNTVVEGVDPVDLEITANTVPQCAMRVKRAAEMGPITAYAPAASCGCFFDSKRGDASQCKACTEANAATVCTGAATKCNHGFCEVK